MKARKADVWFLVREAFPDYRGRKFYVHAAESVTFHDLNWGGGTRNEYVLVELGSGKTASLPNAPPWAQPLEGQTVAMRPGYAVAKHADFCGHDCGITVLVHPADMDGRFLTEGEQKCGAELIAGELKSSAA